MLSLTTFAGTAARVKRLRLAPMNFAPLSAASSAVQLHLAAAVAALALGTVLVVRRKGTPGHMALGRVWVGLMLAVAFSSFWIAGLAGPGRFSAIHLLSAFTLVSLGMALGRSAPAACASTASR